MQATPRSMMTGTRLLPRRYLFERALTAHRSDAEAAALAEQAQARYNELLCRRPTFDNRTLNWHVETHILPGLALYQTLLADGADRQAALDEVGALLATAANNSSRMQGLKWMKRLRLPFWLFRRMVRYQMTAVFPRQGWDVEWVENSRKRIAFNIKRCLYLNVLTSFGAPELTPAFCRLDDLMFEALSPLVLWQRSGTLGRGDAQCDFCYRDGGRKAYPEAADEG